MKKIILHKYKNIDIKLFYYVRHLLFISRVKIYIVVALLIIREVFLKTPYLNIIIASNRGLLDAVTIPLLLSIALGFNSKILIKVAVVLFFPVAVLSVLGRESTAELLANNIYIMLLISIIGLAVSYLKQEHA